MNYKETCFWLKAMDK